MHSLIHSFTPKICITCLLWSGHSIIDMTDTASVVVKLVDQSWAEKCPAKRLAHSRSSGDKRQTWRSYGEMLLRTQNWEGFVPGHALSRQGNSSATPSPAPCSGCPLCKMVAKETAFRLPKPVPRETPAKPPLPTPPQGLGCSECSCRDCHGSQVYTCPSSLCISWVSSYSLRPLCAQARARAGTHIGNKPRLSPGTTAQPERALKDKTGHSTVPHIRVCTRTHTHTLMCICTQAPTPEHKEVTDQGIHKHIVGKRHKMRRRCSVTHRPEDENPRVRAQQ